MTEKQVKARCCKSFKMADGAVAFKINKIYNGRMSSDYSFEFTNDFGIPHGLSPEYFMRNFILID